MLNAHTTSFLSRHAWTGVGLCQADERDPNEAEVARSGTGIPPGECRRKAIRFAGGATHDEEYSIEYPCAAHFRRTH